MILFFSESFKSETAIRLLWYFTMGFTCTIRDFDLWVTIIHSKNFQQSPNVVTILRLPTLHNLNSLDTQN